MTSSNEFVVPVACLAQHERMLRGLLCMSRGGVSEVDHLLVGEHGEALMGNAPPGTVATED